MARQLLSAVVLVLFALTCNAAIAGSGSSFTLPRPKARRPGPIQLKFDLTWVNGNGYRPIRVTATTASGQPAISDQRIQISIYPGAGTTNEYSLRVIDEMVLPEGARSSEKWFYVPQSKPWMHRLTLSTTINGSFSRSLSGTQSFNGNSTWTEAQPSVLYISSAAPTPEQAAMIAEQWRTRSVSEAETFDLPNVPVLADALSSGVARRGVKNKRSDASILSMLQTEERVELRAPADLPDEWIGYTCCDLIFVSLADAQKMANTPQWSAIQKWTATGGSLFVFGVGEDFAELSNVEKLLEMPPLAADKSAPELRGWRSPQARLDKGTIDRPAVNDYYENDYGQFSQGSPRELTPPEIIETTTDDIETSESPFIVREHQLGQVLAIASDEPMNEAGRTLSWLMNTADFNRTMWRQRYGFSLNNTNKEFWKFLIPGVGGAPVISFLVLITVFVLIIGPVNYFVLHSMKRLYLILVTVPLGAAIITGGLFIFALATDGIQTRVRLRSFTDIDQTSGQAVSWSRQAYYAGIAPGGGLVFPDSATVYPIEFHPQGYDKEGASCEIAFTDDQQRLQQGFISSRSWSQFLVVQTQPTERGIDLKAKNGKPPTLQNRLGSRIQLILVADKNGEFWQGENFATEAESELQPAKLDDLKNLFRKFLTDNTPKMPPDFDPDSQTNNGNWWMYQNQIDQEFGVTKMHTSILNRNLNALYAAPPKSVPPGSYIAIVDHSPEVSVGVGWPSLEAGFEVIRGRW